MLQFGQKSYFESLAERQLLDKQPDNEFSKKGEAFVFFFLEDFF